MQVKTLLKMFVKMVTHLHIWWTLVGVSAFEKLVEKELFGVL